MRSRIQRLESEGCKVRVEARGRGHTVITNVLCGGSTCCGCAVLQNLLGGASFKKNASPAPDVLTQRVRGRPREARRRSRPGCGETVGKPASRRLCSYSALATATLDLSPKPPVRARLVYADRSVLRVCALTHPDPYTWGGTGESRILCSVSCDTVTPSQ